MELIKTLFPLINANGLAMKSFKCFIAFVTTRFLLSVYLVHRFKRLILFKFKHYGRKSNIFSIKIIFKS